MNFRVYFFCSSTSLPARAKYVYSLDDEGLNVPSRRYSTKRDTEEAKLRRSYNGVREARVAWKQSKA